MITFTHAESIENAIRCHDNFENKCGNECPFGYGVRADGKIVPGTKALYWLEKIEKEGI